MQPNKWLTHQPCTNVTFEQIKDEAGQSDKEIRGEVETTNQHLAGKNAPTTSVVRGNSSGGVIEGLALAREDHGTGRGASFQCSNIFSIFAVLVFLFALVDFIMGMDGRRRRRRESPDSSWFFWEEPPGGNLEEMTREASLAVALLWRGALLSHQIDFEDNSFDNTFLDSHNTYNTSGKREKTIGEDTVGGGDGCEATVRCKAAKSAAALGRLGEFLSVIIYWLTPVSVSHTKYSKR